MRIAQFIILYQDYNYGQTGLPLKNIVDQQKYQGVLNFVFNELLEMGVQAGDCTLVIAPLIFKIDIQIVLVQKQTHSGLIKTNYSSSIETLQDAVRNTILSLKTLEFYNQKICIFLKSGHYDILYSKNYILSNPNLISSVDKSLQDFLNTYAKQNLKSVNQTDYIQTLKLYSSIQQIKQQTYYDDKLQTQQEEQSQINRSTQDALYQSEFNQNNLIVYCSQKSIKSILHVPEEQIRQITLSCTHYFTKANLKQSIKNYRRIKEFKLPQNLFYQDPQSQTVFQPICPYYDDENKAHCEKELTQEEIIQLYNFNTEQKQKLHYIYTLNTLIKKLSICDLCKQRVIFRKMDGVFHEDCQYHLFHLKCVLLAKDQIKWLNSPEEEEKKLKNKKIRQVLNETCCNCKQKEKIIVKAVSDKACRDNKKCAIF